MGNQLTSNQAARPKGSEAFTTCSRISRPTRLLTWIGVGLSLLAIVLLIIVEVAFAHAINNS